MKKYLLIALVISIVIGSIIPYRTVFVPVWRVRVLDENGQPYKGQLVRQFCDNYSLGVSPCSGSDFGRRTDENGYVEFPERTIVASLVFRIIKTLASYLLLLAHGSVGSEIYLDSSGPGGYRTLRYDGGGGPPPHEFVLPSAK